MSFFFEYCFCLGFYFLCMFMGFYCQNYLEPISYHRNKETGSPLPMEVFKNQQDMAELPKIKKD